MRPAGSALVLSLAVASLSGTAARGDPPAKPPPPSRVEIGDAETPRPRRTIHDVVTALFETREGALHVEMRFKRPLIEGTFECVHLFVDCDANAATGVEGADLQVRASIGSPFQATNADPPADGAPAPATLLRASTSVPKQPKMRGVNAGPVGWTNLVPSEMRPPTVEGTTLSFDVPLAFVVRQGLRYNRFVRVRAEVEGLCSQHPLSLEYGCADEGTPIAVDGKDDDWSGQPRVDRAAGGMHPDTSEVEITSMSVEHDATRVFVLLRLAREGFSKPGHDEVDDQDTITIGLEPLGGGGYMEYRSLEVESGGDLRRNDAPSTVLGPRLVEASFPRRAEQTSFRVLAWGDARRVDRVPNGGWLEVGIPPEALRGK